MTSTATPAPRARGPRGQGGSEGPTTARSLRGSTLLLTGRFLAIGANLFIQVLVVRYLSQEAYGAFAYAIAVVNLLQVGVSLGMEQALQRFAAVYDEEGRPERLAGALVLYLATVLILGALAVTAVLAARTWLAETLIDDPLAVAVLAILVALAPLQALDTLVVNLFAVYARPSAIFFRRYVLAPALKITAALVVILTGQGVVALAWGYVLATVVGLVVFAPVLVRMLVQHGVLRRGTRPQIPYRELFGFTFSAVTADLVVILLFASDAIIVGFIGGTVDVAVLQAAQPLANGNLLIFYAIIPLFLPHVSRLFSQRRTAEAAELYSRCTVWIAVLTFPVAALTVSFAGTVATTLFGERYAEAGPVLAFLALGQYVLALFGLTTMTLKATARLKLLAWANVVVAVLNVVLNLVLVTRYGPVGAAAGTAVSLALLSLLKGLILRRETGVSPVGSSLVVPMTTVLLAGLALAAVELTTDAPLAVAMVLAAVVSLVLVRVNRRQLALGEIFPELLRYRLVRMVVGA